MIELIDYSFAFFLDGRYEDIADEIRNALSQPISKDVIAVSKQSTIDYSLLENKRNISFYKGCLFRNALGNIIYFDNTIGGSYQAMIRNVSREGKHDIVHVRVSKIPQQEGFFFSLFSADGSERIIQSYKDGKKWVFYSSGEVKQFEKEENYFLKQKNQRLNESIIIDYCTKLNMFVTNSITWEPDPDGHVNEFARIKSEIFNGLTNT